MKGRNRKTLDFSGQAHPGAPFGQLLSRPSSSQIHDDWKLWIKPLADPRLITACEMIWRVHVLLRFASRYGGKVTGV